MDKPREDECDQLEGRCLVAELERDCALTQLRATTEKLHETEDRTLRLERRCDLMAETLRRITFTLDDDGR